MRTVYKGDCAKDEYGAAAAYEELGANPTSAQGLNACLVYGSVPGNLCNAAGAVKACVQAFLKSKYKTWIKLRPELRPKWWKDKFVQPVVLLVKALDGHPDAGGMWEQHLKETGQVAAPPAPDDPPPTHGGNLRYRVLHCFLRAVFKNLVF